MGIRVTAALGAALIVTAAGAPAAFADKQIQAGTPQRYTTPEVTIDQGERLTFKNNDFQTHDVVATGVGPDSQPLFSTPLTDQGQENFVAGSQYLTTGTYDFVCSLHSNMTGRVIVTAAGTPQPRPGTGTTPADTQPPALKIAIKTGTVSKARRDKALTVVVTLDEAAKLSVRASTLGKTLGSVKPSVGAGDTKLRIALDAASRRRLRSGRNVVVKITATDAAGNKRSLSAARRLK